VRLFLCFYILTFQGGIEAALALASRKLGFLFSFSVPN